MNDGEQTIITADGAVSLSDAICDAETPAERLSLQLGGMTNQRDTLQWKLHVAKRALEIAARQLDGCPVDIDRDWCGADVVNTLNVDLMGCAQGDDIRADCWLAYLLEQAEAQLAAEQAENAAAEPEELVLTDDMLERMRKRCIHGR